MATRSPDDPEEEEEGEEKEVEEDKKRRARTKRKRGGEEEEGEEERRRGRGQGEVGGGKEGKAGLRRKRWGAGWLRSRSEHIRYTKRNQSKNNGGGFDCF